MVPKVMPRKMFRYIQLKKGVDVAIWKVESSGQFCYTLFYRGVVYSSLIPTTITNAILSAWAQYKEIEASYEEEVPCSRS